MWIETPKDFSKPEYFDEILSKRYKDTPFAIIKNKYGKRWTVYVIIDDQHISGYMEYWTKGYAINEIENGEIYKVLNEKLEVLKTVTNVLNNFYEH